MDEVYYVAMLQVTGALKAANEKIETHNEELRKKIELLKAENEELRKCSQS